jgi:hypothetical protein
MRCCPEDLHVLADPGGITDLPLRADAFERGLLLALPPSTTSSHMFGVTAGTGRIGRHY